MIRLRRLADPVCLGAAFVAAIWWLHRLGDVLPAPAADPATWRGWALDAGAADALFALVRLAALGAAWYLLAVLVLGAAARLTRRRTLVAVVDAVSMGVVRRALDGALALSVTAGSLAVATTPAVWSLMNGPAAVALSTSAQSVPPVMTATPADDPPSTAGAAATPFAGTATMTADPGFVPERAWLVQPGDHFWSIAEATLIARGVPTPTEAETAAYWLRLIDANAAQLLDPANPDLIVPGQVLDLPA
jgi:hypothetical protein